MKNKFNVSNIFTLALAVSFSLVFGCVGREIKESPPYPARPKSVSELRQIINERADNSRPLKLKGRLSYWAGPDAKPRSCLALILADPSQKVRVKGYRSLGPTLFEAASDGDEFLLYTYSTGEITKPTDSGEEAFYSKLLDGVIESLFMAHIGENEILLMECTSKHYILSIAYREKGDYFLKKKIWINSDSLHVDGAIHYDKRGIPTIMITMSNYRKGDPTLPSLINLFWPLDGAILEISIKSIEPAKKIPAGIFSLSDLGERE